MMATEAGQQVVHEHTETANDDKSKPGDEELYVVLERPLQRAPRTMSTARWGRGRSCSSVNRRQYGSFTALEPGSCVVAMGTNPGVEFIVSKFEREVSPPPRWA